MVTRPIHSSLRPALVTTLTALTVVKISVLSVYTVRGRLVMDEFAHGYMARYLTEGLYTAIDPVKTALPLLALRIPLALSLDATQVLTLWRIETLFAALAIVALTCVAAAHLRRDTVSVMLIAFTLLSFSTFIERAFRVRNDTFAVAFGVAGLAALVSVRDGKRMAYLTGLLAGLAFLCTQKAVYLLLPLSVGVMVREWDRESWKAALAQGFRFSASVVGSILTYALAFGGLGFIDVIRRVLFSPLQPQLLNSEAVAGVGHFVGQTLSRNRVAYLLCTAGLIVALVGWRRLDPATKAAAAVTLLVSVLVFSHPQPWPYVFVMALPFLVLWVPWIFEVLPRARRTLWLLVATGLLCWSFARNVHYLEDDNSEQREVVRQAEALLGPNDRYFDGIGMIPTRQIAGDYPWWWWDLPTRRVLAQRWENGESSEIDKILEAQPKVWIQSYRLEQLESVLAPYWNGGTVRVAPYLRLSGLELKAETGNEFRNLWAGPYSLYDSSGNESAGALKVDGDPCALPCHIGAGVSRIAADRDAFLLPADFQSLRRLPYSGTDPDLFEAIYHF